MRWTTTALTLALLCAIAPAHAGTPGQDLLLPLGGGAPSWVPPGASAQLDFANGRYFNTSINLTRSSVKTNLTPNMQAGFSYSSFPVNVPAITPGYGLLIEGGSTNYLLNSTAPATQTTASLTTGTYYLWVNGSGSATMSAGTALGCGSLSATQSLPISFVITSAGTCTVTVSGSLNAFQLEPNAPTSLIATSGAIASRQPDFPTVPNFYSLVGNNGSIGTISATLMMPYQNGITHYAFTGQNFNGVDTQNSGTGGGIQIDVRQSSVAGARGYYSPNLPIQQSYGLFTAAQSWNSSTAPTFGYSGLGALQTATDGQRDFSASIFVLGQVSSSAYWNSYINKITFYKSYTSTMSAIGSISNPPSNAVYAWGDSLTAGVGDTTGEGYPGWLSQLYSPARMILNEGVGGQTSTQIANRFLAASYSWPYNCIIQSGDIDYATPSTVTANIASMIAVGCKKYIIHSVQNSEGNGSTTGPTAYAQVLAINSSLSSTYQSNYNDIRSKLVAAYNPGNPADVIDFNNDTPPFTLRAQDVSGTIIGAINSSSCTFSLSATAGNNFILTVGTEYIYITAETGTSVTGCVRGYAGTTAASYGAGQPFVATDNIHLSTAAYRMIANWDFQTGILGN